MKTWLMILTLGLLFSCSKEQQREVAPWQPLPQVNAVWRGLGDRHQDTIDVMVAFLWPETIETDRQREAVRETIATARRLNPLKQEFLRKKSELDKEFAFYHCACALNGECSEGEDDTQLDACMEVEDKMGTNNRKLADFYALVEKIEELVGIAGGEWIATGTDYPLLPLSRLNPQSLELRLEVFGNLPQDETLQPISYTLNTPTITQTTVRTRLLWAFPRKTPQGEEGQWTIDVGMNPDGESLIFQGDLFWDVNGSVPGR